MSTSPTPGLTAADYPLSTSRPELLVTPTGRPITALTLDAVVSGEVTADDLRITPETLLLQAQLADAGTRPQLAANLRRAAELTAIPDAEVLTMYDALRPWASTAVRLAELADRLELTWSAPVCAAFVREATEVYQRRDLLAHRDEPGANDGPDGDLTGTQPRGPRRTEVPRFDPTPSVRVENGRIVDLDGRSRTDFDVLDAFIADHAIDVVTTEASMALPSDQIARMLVDPRVSRTEVLAVTRGLTPAKILDIVRLMNIAGIMQALQKMQARRRPAGQAQSTSARDNPVQVAADAAEGAVRGCAELETTLGVVHYAPLVAIALQVGAQVGRGGVLTHCALEEPTELELGRRGLTAYTETICGYGTESVFVDGDDTPWSKAFLASAYASRGITMRFTSGTGSAVQMGNAEGTSRVYLEIRCILMAKGAGVPGLQHGSSSCLGVPGAVPGGMWAVAAENLVASMVDLDRAPGDDQSFSHSAMRRTIPRDLQIDGGLRHVPEQEIRAVRNEAARALQALFAHLDLPPITDEEVAAATDAHSSNDYPFRDVLADLTGAQSVLDRGITGLDLVKGLEATGFHDAAVSLLAVLRHRVSGDLLQGERWSPVAGTPAGQVRGEHPDRGGLERGAHP
ncbi:diol dehydratase small subunit [Pseudonocardia hispaniensis]|uniref:Diol dehydratase small subunit n=1 Tax=Pseudonocardia hispaniensis TaxID=904933 RepID=A0ABW1J625_9PSEU